MEPLPEQGASEIPAVRKPSKETPWMGPKESAVRQHRQEMKTKMKTNKVEEAKPARPKQVGRGECRMTFCKFHRLDAAFCFPDAHTHISRGRRTLTKDSTKSTFLYIYSLEIFIGKMCATES